MTPLHQQEMTALSVMARCLSSTYSSKSGEVYLYLSSCDITGLIALLRVGVIYMSHKYSWPNYKQSLNPMKLLKWEQGSIPLKETRTRIPQEGKA